MLSARTALPFVATPAVTLRTKVESYSVDIHFSLFLYLLRVLWSYSSFFLVCPLLSIVFSPSNTQQNSSSETSQQKEEEATAKTKPTLSSATIKEEEEEELWIKIVFTPTVPHCSLATLIGLCLRAKLERCLENRFKLDIVVLEGAHAIEADVNKQINDKERVAAAMENPGLREMVEECIKEAEY